jgi:hypothetical protein
MVEILFAVTMLCGAPEPLPNETVSAIMESGVLMDEVYGSHPYDLPTEPSVDGYLSYRIIVDPIYQSYGRCFSHQVRNILTDERSWPNIREAAPGEIPQVWVVLTPPALCRGSATSSCAAGRDGEGQIWMNYNRWMVGSDQTDDLFLDRAHVINHEVGHHLGFIHTTCAIHGSNVMTPTSRTSHCNYLSWPAIGEKIVLDEGVSHPHHHYVETKAISSR